MGFYLEFIRSVFQATGADGKLRTRIVAFTSASPGEGVSHVVSTIAHELAGQTQNRVLVATADALETISAADPNQISHICRETEVENLLTLTAQHEVETVTVANESRRTSNWETSAEFRKECLAALRWNFDYVVIDCTALSVSAQATTLSPIVDGVSIVVKAGQTRRHQIHRSQQTIEAAGGNFLGFVLNQRRYPVPGWLYRML